jgi:acetolactate synthase regulatory subunit
MSWAISKMNMERLGIHASETAWIGRGIDLEVDNNGSIDDLFSQIKNLVEVHPETT